MTENHDRNKPQNDQKTEKELFQIGGPGGPGRGNSRKKQEMSQVVASIKSLSQNENLNLMDSEILDLIGRLIMHDVTSEDTKTRIDSIKQFLSLLGKRIEAQERESKDSSVSPETIERFAEIVRVRQDQDVIIKMLCDDCKAKLGIDESSKEND